MNEATQSGDAWVCTCGAKSGRDGLKRFLERHPAKCEERRAFSKELAGGTHCVEDFIDPDAPKQTQTTQYRIATVNGEGRNLTDWEREFMLSISAQWNERGFITEKQSAILERIYTERT